MNVGEGGVSSAEVARAQDEAVRLTMLLRAFMTHGHYVADIDPLEIRKHYPGMTSLHSKFMLPDEELTGIVDPKRYGFTEADMDK